MPHPFWKALIQTRQGLAISAQHRILPQQTIFALDLPIQWAEARSDLPCGLKLFLPNPASLPLHLSQALPSSKSLMFLSPS